MCSFVLSLGNWRAHGQHFLCMTVCKISDHREGQWRLFLRVSMKASWRQHGDGGGAVRPQFDSKAWVEMWKSQCIPHTDTLMLAISRHLAGKQVRKHPPSKAVVFPVVTYGCESWTIKKAEHQKTDAFKLWSWRTQSPMDCKEIKPVNPKGNQPWIYIGRADAEAYAPILWLPDVKSQLIGKDLDAGKDWWDRGKEVTEDETVRQLHQLSAYEFEQTPGDSERQGSLASCSLWGHKESVVSGCTTTFSNIAGQRGLGRKPETGRWDLEAQGKPGALC